MDFLRAKRVPLLGSFLLALGVTALATTFSLSHEWAGRAAKIERDDLRAAAARQVRLPPPKPALVTPYERRAQQALVELQRPWLASLRAIESATREPVFLLGLTIEPATGVIRLDAEAATFDQALGYVERLSASPGLLPATLVSHEAAATLPPGQGAVRFTVSTRWAVR